MLPLRHCCNPRKGQAVSALNTFKLHEKTDWWAHNHIKYLGSTTEPLLRAVENSKGTHNSSIPSSLRLRAMPIFQLVEVVICLAYDLLTCFGDNVGVWFQLGHSSVSTGFNLGMS